jgi:hypothetical protein
VESGEDGRHPGLPSVAIDVAAGAVDPLGDEELPGGPTLFVVEVHAETRSPTKTTAITRVDTIPLSLG